jgi:eukaryotic-like serine/threonine-protein kinase
VGEHRRCPACGSERPAGSHAEGPCPFCLLGLALTPAEADAVEDAADLLVPETEYRVLTILGTDAAGTTYLAEQERPRRLVTLHVAKLGLPSSEQQRREIRDRAAALERLFHPAIQPIIEARRTATGDGCVVGAYVQGQQLTRYCQSSRVDDEGRATVFATICDGVDYAHGQGVCHGRLTPDMVVMRPTEGDPAAPVLVGFSLFDGSPPGVDADIEGLEAIARALGWSGPAPARWESVRSIRDTVCGCWRKARSRG